MVGGFKTRGLKSIIFSLRHRSYNPIKFWNDRRKLGLGFYQPISNSEKRQIEVVVKNFGKRVLEVGCGTQNFSYLSYYVGVDFSIIALKGQKDVCCADVRYLPFRNKCFDVTISRGTLMHVPDIQGAIDEITRVTRRVVVLREELSVGKLAKHCFNHDYQSLMKGWSLWGRFPYEVFVCNER